MSKKSLLPQSRRHIWVYDEDFEYLEKAFGKDTPSRMGVGPMVREIIHTYVKALRAREAARVEQRRASA